MVIIQAIGDFDGLEAARAFDFGLDIRDPVRLQSDQLRQLVDRLLRIAHPLRNNIDPEVSPVGSQWRAVTIQYPATPGRYQCQVDAIAFRFRLVFLVLGNGEV